MITYSLSKGKVILCKDNVYFSLDTEEIPQLEDLLVHASQGTDSIYYRKDSRSKSTKVVDKMISNISTANAAAAIVQEVINKRT